MERISRKTRRRGGVFMVDNTRRDMASAGV